ncbi:Las1-like protein [Schizosaccharomyces cryophilus OY26]|uniref:Las1-like protein n=1 Tax=Schizosaccharomyces cryophilus (strain OY26 / ATCC MYA-4695 / CBS 11777 / NBRC 106824 / NRRL Y48691) TaxID=653667 RepID=S9XFU9_SCHCR|nr:Las1-like protein [Schizosaccharomyces cryophilus OY26]EPY52511.1 Las1-like protein [Schizosaccharomyces cryophilus OY26]
MDLKLVPWRSKEDFLFLMSCFYNEELEEIPDPSALYRGIEIVHSWSTRGRIPHSIEATAQLALSLLNNDPSQKLSLSLAISRFVSGLLDPIQQSQYAVPMAILAKSIDLPTSFVEIRHAITHEELPSLPVLRQTANRALAWLYDHYWIRAANASSEIIDDTLEVNEMHKNDIQKRVRELLKKWRSWRKVNVSANMTQSASEHRYVREFEELCSEIVSISSSRLPYILASFVSDEQDLNFALETTNLEIVVSCFLERRILIPSKITSNNLFPKAINLWLPLIQNIASKHSLFLPALQALLWSEINEVSLSNQNSAFFGNENNEEYKERNSACMFLTNWYAYLMKAAYKSEPWANTMSITQTELASLLEVCLQRSDPFTRVIIDELLPLDKELEEKYVPLCQYRGDAKNVDITMEENTLAETTVDQMQDDLNQLSTRLASITEPEESKSSGLRAFENRFWYKPKVELAPIGHFIVE